MNKTELARMTASEAAERLGENPVVLLPMGSIEEHGPQSPIGDYRAADHISRQIAANTGSVSCPVIPFGYSETYRNYLGTMTVSHETLQALIYDLVTLNFLDKGLDHIVLVSGHGGNNPIIEFIGREIMSEYGLRIAHMDLWRMLTPIFYEETYGMKNPPIGHGGEPIGSVNAYLFPEDMRMDLVEKGHPNQYGDLELIGLRAVKFEDTYVHMFFDMEEGTPNGVWGDPRELTSAETGKKMIDRLVGIGTRFVEWFKTFDTALPTD